MEILYGIVFPGRWCPARILVTVAFQALRRVSEGVGDSDVTRDLSKGGKVKQLGLLSSHIRSGCP